MAAGQRGAARSVLDGGEHGGRLGQAWVNCGETDMRDTSLLQLALGVAPPWTVVSSDFDTVARRLDIYIDFTTGSRFTCPSCAAGGSTADPPWLNAAFSSPTRRCDAGARNCLGWTTWENEVPDIGSLPIPQPAETAHGTAT